MITTCFILLYVRQCYIRIQIWKNDPQVIIRHASISIIYLRSLEFCG